MKLFKIGSNSKCDIVLNSPYVSGLHAELTSLPEGNFILEDKNSTNGTTVNGKKIEGAKEITVVRGDKIVFGDTPLNWNAIPQHEKFTDCKKVLNIGSNFRNELQITDPYVSRYHAILKIDKNGKPYIKDLKSKNGVLLNGIKIPANQWVPIKYKDTVNLGNIDITDQIKGVIPVPCPWLKIVAAVVIAAAVLVGGYFGYRALNRTGNVLGGTKPTIADVRTSVVYVTASFQLNTRFEDCPIHPEIWNAVIRAHYPNIGNCDTGELPVQIQSYSATAFFLDREGRMATNRHVASPWELEYLPASERAEIRTEMEKMVNEQLPLEINQVGRDLVDTYNAAYQMSPTKFMLWGMIYTQAQNLYAQGKISDFYGYIDSLIRQLKNCKRSITGNMLSISVGYAGINYTHEDEYDRCDVVAVSPSDDMDIAILQLNKKRTPDIVKFVFSPENFFTGTLEPQKDKLMWIGYPRGNMMARDQITHSIEPQIRNTVCSKVPSKYSFEFQGESLGGASGSPIFNAETFQLVGVLWGGYTTGATYGLACQAKYLKRLYDEEVGNI